MHYHARKQLYFRIESLSLALMCGIVGVIARNAAGKQWFSYVSHALPSVAHRGPDAQRTFSDEGFYFGHCRLSVIDVSEAAHQPMVHPEVVLTYNGEIFNYPALRTELAQSGVVFQTHSDTEVLLQAYRHYGINVLHLLNGFFAFGLFDRKQQKAYVVRDRFGEKPLYYYFNDDVLVFASTLQALLSFPIAQSIDRTSLVQYLQLNFIPAPFTILQNVFRLLPGSLLEVDPSATEWVQCRRWFSPMDPKEPWSGNAYPAACQHLFELMDDSVRIRLTSDVPLGVFLSGGLDSSVVAALACRHKPKLQTFSIGFPENKFFDETPWALAVAKHIGSEHVVFPITRKQLGAAVDGVLDRLGEPFADSSALAVFLLSQCTRQSVKVALSGDAGDELFAGYLRHAAHYRMLHQGFVERLILLAQPFWAWLPQSRNATWTNRFRQLHRFASGHRHPLPERYWQWSTVASYEEVYQLLSQPADEQQYLARKQQILQPIRAWPTMEGVLLNDLTWILPDDMLVKVDTMSMAHGLEVRPPFLDHRVVAFAMSLPAHFKIDKRRRKKIVYDTFSSLLPKALFHKPKRGFELPLHALLTHELKEKVEQCCHGPVARELGLFDPEALHRLQRQLFSTNPGDSPARMWNLIVLVEWIRRNLL